MQLYIVHNLQSQNCNQIGQSIVLYILLIVYVSTKL